MRSIVTRSYHRLLLPLSSLLTRSHCLGMDHCYEVVPLLRGPCWFLLPLSRNGPWNGMDHVGSSYHCYEVVPLSLWILCAVSWYRSKKIFCRTILEVPLSFVTRCCICTHSWSQESNHSRIGSIPGTVHRSRCNLGTDTRRPRNRPRNKRVVPLT